jgi:hypothetical protein
VPAAQVPPVPSKVEHAVYFVHLKLGKCGLLSILLSLARGG